MYSIKEIEKKIVLILISNEFSRIFISFYDKIVIKLKKAICYENDWKKIK